MKRKDTQALHLKNHAELARELNSKRQELTRLRLEKSVKREKNNRRFKNLRHDIAVMATILSELQMKQKEGS